MTEHMSKSGASPQALTSELSTYIFNDLYWPIAIWGLGHTGELGLEDKHRDVEVICFVYQAYATAAKTIMLNYLMKLDATTAHKYLTFLLKIKCLSDFLVKFSDAYNLHFLTHKIKNILTYMEVWYIFQLGTSGRRKGDTYEWWDCW